MEGIENTKKEMPILKNDERMYVDLQGSHFQQKTVLTSNNVINHVINTNVINIPCVYKLDPIASSRDTTFTIQNALFGAMQLLKMLIIQTIIIQDMVYVLMREVSLVIQ